MKIYKTNKMQVYNKAYNYIIDSIDTEGYDVTVTANTDKEKLQFVIDTFNAEQGFNIKREGQQKAFVGWLMGLPSCIHIEFVNYKIIELAKEWGSIEEDATEKEEDRIIESWFRFIYMRFVGLCRKNKIQF